MPATTTNYVYSPLRGVEPRREWSCVLPAFLRYLLLLLLTSNNNRSQTRFLSLCPNSITVTSILLKTCLKPGFSKSIRPVGDNFNYRQVGDKKVLNLSQNYKFWCYTSLITICLYAWRCDKQSLFWLETCSIIIIIMIIM